MINKKYSKTLEYLRKKKKILFLTTSNRWNQQGEIPKSTLLARNLAKQLNNVTLIDVPSLKIYPCEGNVSNKAGNNCGVKKALLKDRKKNPSGCHRCWASLNNKDDELWKVSKEIINSDCAIFFTSVRWGQTNSYYQKLIERLTWLENRHTTLKEKNILENIDAGIIIIGQNWNGKKVLSTQKKVLKFYGFNVIRNLCWNWNYSNESDESQESYKKSFPKFKKEFIE